MAAHPPSSCWILTDGLVGKVNQCLGLAEAVGFADWAIQPKIIKPRFPWRFLPPRWWFRPLAADPGAGLTPPWPQLLICCGRSAVAPAAAIRRLARGGCIVVAVQEPKLPNSSFDLVITAFHDRLKGENLLQTSGALNRISARTLEQGRQEFAAQFAHLPRPLVGVILGGSNRRMKISDQAVHRLLAQLRGLVAAGCGLVVTTSRRTPPEVVAACQQLVAEVGTKGLILWAGDGSEAGKNPYFGILALADALLITADSVSMISEAATSGKPVYIAEISHSVGKFDQFVSHMINQGIARRFAGELDPPWSYEPLQDTATAALQVRKLLAAIRSEDKDDPST
ncbi:MAG: mitochondrial fission ELM1 family protein [Alphaproteobacteria bacterium]|nr:mitochondrial fission ELM1 family protein [Alphaproteobacteria bacterium]